MSSPALMKNFALLQADWDVDMAKKLLSHIRAKHLIVHQRSGRDLYYLFNRFEAEEMLKRKSGEMNLVAALDLDVGNATPTFSAFTAKPPKRGVAIEDTRVVGFVDQGAKGVTRGTTRGTAEPPSPYFLSAEFPQEVQLDDVDSLTVEISTKDVGRAIQIQVKKGAVVDIIVQPREGFELQEKGEKNIVVDEESPPLQFKLKAVQLGEGRINVLAYHDGKYLGSIKLQVSVVGKSLSDSARRVSYEAKMAPPLPRAVKPDLSLLILQNKIDGKTRLNFRLFAADHTLGVHNKWFQPIELETDPFPYFEKFFEDIENLPFDTAEQKKAAETKLADKGAHLSDLVIPKDLQKLLWSLQGSIKTVHIESDEPWIPWEICKLKGEQNGRTIIGPFMCEAFAITRWMPNTEGSPWPTLSANKLAIVVPTDSDLPYVRDEKRNIMALASKKGTPEEVPAKFIPLHEALSKGEHDIWHFSGHGGFVDPDPDRSCIVLEEPDRLTPENLAGEAANLGLAHPLVFLNACQVGKRSMSLTAVGGMASKFLQARAGAFIGAYWSVYDKAAHDFAIKFYERLFAGVPVGVAVKEARQKVKDTSPGDPTRLAYVVFADPFAALRSS